MNGYVVLITGGADGHWPRRRHAFAREGAIVVVAGRREEAGAELVKELRAFGSGG